MNCKGIVAGLIDYMEGTIDASVREEMDEHLHWCNECYVLLNTTRKTIEIYQDSDIFDVPKGFPDEFRLRLHNLLTSKHKPDNKS